MTYNFDPERWYDNELAFLKRQLQSGRIDNQRYQQRCKQTQRRYEAMWRQLDGTYQIPPASPKKDRSSAG
jgi:hypothetical protein